MRSTLAGRLLFSLLVGATLFGALSTDLLAQDQSLMLSDGGLVSQIVVNPAAASGTIGPARNWEYVDPSYQYYYGPNYGYDDGWYASRNVGYPNNYVAYASDPADVCSTEYYYMPSDGVYYCYQPDPVALNSNLQSTCPNQPYLYICP